MNRRNLPSLLHRHQLTENPDVAHELAEVREDRGRDVLQLQTIHEGLRQQETRQTQELRDEERQRELQDR